VRAPATAAVLTESPATAVGDALALAVFADTGATTLYHSNPRIRFREAYRAVPGQAQRRSWLRRIAAEWRPCRYRGARYVLRARDR
jgi:hypothetical protein